eukprot:1394570-Ditylum_brightwellii.AAC.1
MFRNQYDTDVTVWSPEGRLLQVRILMYRGSTCDEQLCEGLQRDLFDVKRLDLPKRVEYAMESVKQGSACLGLRSSTHSVLGALKRSVSEHASHQKKLLEIDDHMGIGIAGLTADARTIAKWMRNECLNHKYVYGTPMPSG